MASSSRFYENEGRSLTRAPFFDGTDYAYWKTMMEDFLTAYSLDLWEIVRDGPYVPQEKVKRGELEELIEKSRDKYTDEDKRLVALNAKAKSAFHCALSRSEFNHVQCCKSAHEIWNKLELKYEGTSQVRETKINMYIHDFELFPMKPDETISDMYTRLTDILNSLESLGKSYSDFEKVQKVLRSLPEAWDPKVTAIQEAKDTKKMSLDELMGSLMTHELTLKNRYKNKDSLKTKSIALPVTQESSGEEDSEEEIVMLARRLRKFMKKKKSSSNKPKMGESSNEKKSEITCYNCGKIGHYKSECPKSKKFRSKGRRKEEKKERMAFKATWDDSSESESYSSDEEEEKANFCMMAKGERNSSPTDEEVNSSEMDELLEEFNFLFDEHKRVVKENKELKRENGRLEKKEEEYMEEIDELNVKIRKLEENASSEALALKETINEMHDTIDSLREHNSTICDHSNFLQEIACLKEMNEHLEKSFAKFSMSSSKLDSLLASQKPYFEKAGIGFDLSKQKDKNTKILFFYSVHSFQAYI